MRDEQHRAWLDLSALQSPTAVPTTQPVGWQQHAPLDPFDPTVNDVVSVINGVSGWLIAGASVRGKMHAHYGTYREDAFTVGIADPWQIAVICDGAGSSALSRVGATVVCDALIAGVRRGLALHWHGDEAPNDQLRHVLLTGMIAARAALDLEAQRRGVHLTTLASTLLVLLHDPQQGYLATAQIGDGVLFAILANQQILALAEAQSGAHAGETIFFGDIDPNDWPGYLRVHRIHEPPTMLLAMTDGVADDLLPYSRYVPEVAEEILDAVTRSDPEAALLQVLRYEKPGSSDDRTLVALVR